MLITYQTFQGEELRGYLEQLAQLRMTVFREFPYLYDGDFDYEQRYLQRYVRTPSSCVVLAMDEGKVVGATTCLPLSDEIIEIQTPYLIAGADVDSTFYFGESVVLAEYRGQGIGREFFRRREDFARDQIDLKWTSFAAVDRPDDHPLRPEDYRPLNAFWESMGYFESPTMKLQLSWKDIDQPASNTKSLNIWLKPAKSAKGARP